MRKNNELFLERKQHLFIELNKCLFGDFHDFVCLASSLESHAS